MTKKIISYELENGTIPSYVLDGGYFPNWIESEQKNILLGVSIDDAIFPENVIEYENEIDLIEYLNTYTSSHMNIDPITRQPLSPWSQEEGAKFLFSKIMN